jgi:hypothetical protein
MPRTADATVQLINTYPWDQQRDHLAIGLTNPSITIEGIDNDYLKLSPWYNGKFVLHYFDRTHHLYTRSFDHLSDATPLIRTYFASSPPDLSTFKKEITWLQSNTAHFRTVEFIYSMRLARLTSVALLALYTLFISATFTGVVIQHPPFYPILLMPLVLLFLIIRLAMVAVNHYRSAKDKVLIISRGKQEFSYGPAATPERFNKNDIKEIITYGRRAKGGFTALTRVEIRFLDGRCINISCLMIPQETLTAKFPHCSRSEVGTTFPLIIPSAAVPSG